MTASTKIFSPKSVGFFTPLVHRYNRHKPLGTDGKVSVTEPVDLMNNSDGRVNFDDSVDVFDPHTYLAQLAITGKSLIAPKDSRVSGMEWNERRTNGDNVKQDQPK